MEDMAEESADAFDAAAADAGSFIQQDGEEAPTQEEVEAQAEEVAGKLEDAAEKAQEEFEADPEGTIAEAEAK